jgi:CubicO group peptidase (beta-lactamase class C family)
MVKYVRFLIGDSANPVYDFVLKRSSLEEAWTGVLPVEEQDQTAYSKDAPRMGLGFFVLSLKGHRYVYHDGDQGGFSSEIFIDPARHVAAILAVNTTDTGAPATSTALHPQSNTEPEPSTDLRLALRQELIENVFPTF